MPPRQQILTIMARLYHYGMTTTSGGNLSIKEPNGDIWITPSGVDKGALRESDMLLMRGDRVVEGVHRPSTEYPFHRAILEKRPDFGAVLHAHSSALVAFSIVGKIPDTRILPQASRICGKVGFAPYAIPGSELLGKNIAETFAQGFDTVILENHGVATGGADLLQAFQRFETLEFCARAILAAAGLGEVLPLSEAQIGLLDHHRHLDLPESASGHRSFRERELRRTVAETVHRAYDQRLMTSTEGSLSARVDGDAFLITPYGIDRQYLGVEDLVLMQGGAREAGKIPSRAAALHAEVYRQHPAVNAIISAQPPGVTAFNITGTPLDTRTIPESYIVLRDLPLLPYGLPFNDEKGLAARLTPHSPVLMIQNDSVMAVGRSVTEAFDRLEVAEFTATSLLQGRSIGTLAEISAERIREIEETFKLQK
jgi:L-fuculose-phosphate aldolase